MICGKIPPGVWFLSCSKFEWKGRSTYKYKADFTSTVAAERANLLTHEEVDSEIVFLSGRVVMVEG
jgi:hypothetical protein